MRPARKRRAAASPAWRSRAARSLRSSTGTCGMQVCVPVKQPGTYVVSVRHDANGNGKSDRSDGGGMSGNPDMKVTDFIFKRKPRSEEHTSELQSLMRISYAVFCLK